mmetsp:Transcript_59669/g.67874  ORF Transcript_59669/g.67874 Transcript_59669/m.67874 type:complete len:615 (+) Transcript_59669:48-1892(+)
MSLTAPLIRSIAAYLPSFRERTHLQLVCSDWNKAIRGWKLECVEFEFGVNHTPFPKILSGGEGRTISSLNLSFLEIDSEHLVKCISNIRGLKVLDLNSTLVSLFTVCDILGRDDYDIEENRIFRHLDELNLARTQQQRKGDSSFKICDVFPSVKSLDLSKAAIESDGLSEFLDLPNLESISLFEIEYTSSDLVLPTRNVSQIQFLISCQSKLEADLSQAGYENITYFYGHPYRRAEEYLSNLWRGLDANTFILKEIFTVLPPTTEQRDEVFSFLTEHGYNWIENLNDHRSNSVGSLSYTQPGLAWLLKNMFKDQSPLEVHQTIQKLKKGVRSTLFGAIYYASDKTILEFIYDYRLHLIEEVGERFLRSKNFLEVFVEKFAATRDITFLPPEFDFYEAIYQLEWEFSPKMLKTAIECDLIDFGCEKAILKKKGSHICSLLGKLAKSPEVVELYELVTQKCPQWKVDFNSALIWRLMQARNLEGIKHLLKVSPGLWDCVDWEGKTLVHLAFSGYDADICNFFLQQPESCDYVNVQDHNGQTPLHQAVRWQDASWIVKLMDIGAECLEDNKEAYPADYYRAYGGVKTPDSSQKSKMKKFLAKDNGVWISSPYKRIFG